MHLVPVIPYDEATAEQRRALEEWGEDRGVGVPSGPVWGALVAAPECMRRIAKVGAHVRVGLELPADLKEIAALVTVTERDFRYEIDIHTAKVVALGLDPAAVVAGGRDLSPVQRDVADLARALANGRPVPDRVRRALSESLEAHLLVELVTVVSYFVMLSAVAGTLL